MLEFATGLPEPRLALAIKSPSIPSSEHSLRSAGVSNVFLSLAVLAALDSFTAQLCYHVSC